MSDKMNGQTTKPRCDQCKKRHFGQCLLGSGKCYRCGDAGHRAVACPLDKKNDKLQGHEEQAEQMNILEGNNMSDASQIYGNQSVLAKEETCENIGNQLMKGVSAITPQEIKKSEGVVIGMFLISH